MALQLNLAKDAANPQISAALGILFKGGPAQ
jgi:hypothetical protein